jgi:hypothetical protein
MAEVLAAGAISCVSCIAALSVSVTVLQQALAARVWWSAVYSQCTSPCLERCCVCKSWVGHCCVDLWGVLVLHVHQLRFVVCGNQCGLCMFAALAQCPACALWRNHAHACTSYGPLVEVVWCQ